MLRPLIILLILAANHVSGQITFIAGFNACNYYIEGFEYGNFGTSNGLNLFYFAPQVGIKYNFNDRFAIRYTKSIHPTFNRFYAAGAPGLQDVRSLDRLNVLYSFKSGMYLTSGLTYHLFKSELYYYPDQEYGGNFGINLGFGKEYTNGYWEVSNLLAFEFSELTPASLFGYWTFDIGYFIPLKNKAKKYSKNEETVFGFGLLGAISYFDNRSTIPSHSVLTPLRGVDLHFKISRLNTEFFWRRLQSIAFVPGFLFQAQWNNIGIRQHFTTKKGFAFYGTASFISGFDAVQSYPAVPDIYIQDFSIRGFTLGAGIPVKNWAFELSADCYLDVPVPHINKGFGWDRIKASVIYNLPIITK